MQEQQSPARTTAKTPVQPTKQKQVKMSAQLRTQFMQKNQQQYQHNQQPNQHQQPQHKLHQSQQSITTYRHHH